VHGELVAGIERRRPQAKMPSAPDVPIAWRGGEGASARVSHVDLHEDIKRERPTRPADEFRDRIVIVGATAAGLHDIRITPVSHAHPGVEILAAARCSVPRGGAGAGRRRPAALARAGAVGAVSATRRGAIGWAGQRTVGVLQEASLIPSLDRSPLPRPRRGASKSAALLVDEAFPGQPVRQWVPSVSNGCAATSAARLAALVPELRVNLTRFHSVFAPNSAHRAQVTEAGRGKGGRAHAAAEIDERTPAERRASMNWAHPPRARIRLRHRRFDHGRGMGHGM